MQARFPSLPTPSHLLHSLTRIITRRSFAFPSFLLSSYPLSSPSLDSLSLVFLCRYEFSKLKKFLRVIRFMMEDTLRILVSNSLEKFVSFIEAQCDCMVEEIGRAHV